MISEARRARCRINGRNWYARHAPVMCCDYCGTTLEFKVGSRRKHRCDSPICHRQSRLKAGRSYQVRAQTAFLDYKESIGCSRCGYNKYGGSLDLHHRNPDEKKCSLTCKDFYGKTQRWVTESPKCDLLCKNCHYEEHFDKRENIACENAL